jgi:hypothetical protein
MNWIKIKSISETSDMKKIYKKIVLALCSFGIVFSAKSQTESTLSFMDDVYQSTYYSPFNKSTHKLSIGLPVLSSIYANVANTGFTMSDYFPNGFDQKIDPSKAIDGMKKNEYIGTNVKTDLFHLYYLNGSNGFSFNITENIDYRFTYASDAMRFAWYGNGHFKGKTADLSGFGVDLNHYREYAFGYYKTWEKWQFGGKAKFLFGKYAVSTKTSDLSIGVSDDVYQQDAKGNFVLNMGGYDINQFDTTDISDKAITDYIFNKKNKGFALDLGAAYAFNDKLQFNAALTNIGSIKWKNEAQSLRYSENIAFGGVDVFDVLLNNDLDSLDKAFENYFDELLPDSVKIDSVQESFRTRLPWNFALGARYEFYKNTYAVGRLNFTGYKGIRTAFTVGVYHDFFRWLNIGLTNTSQYGKVFNPGLGLVLKPGPFQFYLAADNLGAARFTRTKFANFHFGMNLVFGKVKGQEKISSVVK